MKLKPITKQQNKKRIMIYYSLALIFASIGLYRQDNPIWYVTAAAFLGLALFRKYWLMKRLFGH